MDNAQTSPHAAAARQMRWLTVGLVIVCVLVFALGHHIAPMVESISPGCFFYNLTHIKCPGCGGTRACTALLQGDWLATLRWNAFWLPTAIVLVILYVQGWLNAYQKQDSYPLWNKIRAGIYKLYGLCILVFVIARNIWDF